MTDTMNYACDGDVYRLWARMLTGEDMDGIRLEAHFHAAHITRRHHNRHYQLSREQLLERLGGNLLLHGPTPPAYRVNLGDEMYLVRYSKLEDLHQAHLLGSCPGALKRVRQPGEHESQRDASHPEGQERLAVPLGGVR
ncbi:hypothetical protein ACN28S_49580 [Cystobacter fuscus]